MCHFNFCILIGAFLKEKKEKKKRENLTKKALFFPFLSGFALVSLTFMLRS